MSTTSRSTAKVRRSTPAEIASSEADRVEVEAEALDAEWLIVPFKGVDVRVKPLMDWPRGVYRAAINHGDLDALADIIHEDDVETWTDTDATVGECFDWLGEVAKASGQDMGESRASRRASARAARR